MVIGNGLLAKGFNEYATDSSCLVFASGVSISANTEGSAFNRERNLLKQAIAEHAEKKFIYFSTCSIYDPSLQKSPYVQHKLAMEEVIEMTHSNFVIFRVSNLVGKTDNPHTVFNFFIQHIVSGSFFYVWEKASRNIIDISDALVICRHIINEDLFQNQIVNVANPVNYPVLRIVTAIENHFGKKGNYELIDKESTPVIDIKPIGKIIKTLAINFDEYYLERALKKYFPLNDL